MTGKGRHSKQYSNPELENQKKKPSVKDKTRTSDKQKDDKEILDAQEKTESELIDSEDVKNKKSHSQYLTVEDMKSMFKEFKKDIILNVKEAVLTELEDNPPPRKKRKTSCGSSSLDLADVEISFTETEQIGR